MLERLGLGLIPGTGWPMRSGRSPEKPSRPGSTLYFPPRSIAMRSQLPIAMVGGSYTLPSGRYICDITRV